MTDAKTKVLGLLTHLIGHSLSSLLQNTLATVYGGSAAYLPFEVRNPEELGAAIYSAHALGIAGFNATVPYKKAVVPHLCGLSEETRLIGAVNTLVRTEEGYVGYNTDITGIVTVLVRRNLRMEGAHILLLGAGDAAWSAMVLAATGGAAELVILNRNTARAEALAKAVRDINPFLTVRAAALEHWRELPGNDYLCIQCTSVGMQPNTEETIVEDPRFFEKLSAVADIVYAPEETKFLRPARVAGKPVAGGLVMPVSQSAYAFSLWTGRRCTAEQEEELLALAKRALLV